MKISYKLILMFALASSLPILSISYFGVKFGTETITFYISKHLSAEADSLLCRIDRIVQARQEDAVVLANNIVLRNEKSSLGEIKKELLKFKDKNPDYVSLSFFNMDRIRLVDTEDLELGKQHDMTPYWEDALVGKISVGHDVRIAEELKIPIFYLAAPVQNFSRNPIGVVVARYSSEKIKKVLDDFTAEEAGKEETYGTVIDKDRNILFSSHPHYKDMVLKEKMPDTPVVRAALSGKTGTMDETDPFSKKEMIAAFATEKSSEDFLGNRWSLVTVSEKSGVIESITDFRNKVILLGSLFFALAVLIGFLYSNGIIRSLKNLVWVSEKVSAGNLKERATVKSKDELGYLAKVFNQMLGNLEEAETRMKEVNAGLEQRVVERTKELNEAKAGLEKTVEQRTAELKEKLVDLERFEKMAVGRELKMVELKNEIERLKGQVPQG